VAVINCNPPPAVINTTIEYNSTAKSLDFFKALLLFPQASTYSK
jgi:hypothetical protein